jgi:ATP-dependent Clp protease adaptor protein ClpS
MAMNQERSGAASPRTTRATTLAPQEVEPRLLPPFRVLLHNDDKNSMDHVAESIVMLTPLQIQEAVERTLEAHHTGVSLLLVTHKERAELYVEQFRSRHLTVSIEPAD